MSTSCQKSYSFFVATNLLYYWTLDEPNPGDTRIDKDQSVVLTPLTGGGFALPGVGAGLFSNGVVFNNPAPQSAELLSSNPILDPKINYVQGQGLTAWGWFKMNAAYVAGGGPLVLPFDFSFFDDNVGTNRFGEISIILGGAQYISNAFDNTLHSIVAGPAFAPVIGAWNFVVTRYDTATGFVSLRVNAGAFVTGVTALNMKTGAFGQMAINSTGGGSNLNMTVDEVGIVKKVLTNAQHQLNCTKGIASQFHE